MAVLVAAICILSVSAWPGGQKVSDSLAITGDIPSPVSLKVDDLDKMENENAAVDEGDGISAKYTAVPLRTVLEKAGAPMGRQASRTVEMR